MATSWRNCRASIVLADEVNRRWPGRDRASDGTIGDAAHATRISDHNPWMVVARVGVVRARDIDKDGIDAPWLVEHLRQLGERGDRRLTGGGYLIFNRRITTPDWRGWRVYTGRNPHTSHVHVSFSRNPAGFDSAAPWGIWPLPAPPPPPPPPAPPAPPMGARPVLRRGDTGTAVELVHRFLGVARPGEPGYGRFGPATEAAVERYQRMRGLHPDGVVGPATWTAMQL